MSTWPRILSRALWRPTSSRSAMMTPPTVVIDSTLNRAALLAALTEAAGCGPEDVIHSVSGVLCYIPLGQE